MDQQRDPNSAFFFTRFVRDTEVKWNVIFHRSVSTTRKQEQNSGTLDYGAGPSITVRPGYGSGQQSLVYAP